MIAAEYRAVRFDLKDNEQPKYRKSNFMDLSHASGFANLGPKTVTGPYICLHAGIFAHILSDTSTVHTVDD